MEVAVSGSWDWSLRQSSMGAAMFSGEKIKQNGIILDLLISVASLDVFFMSYWHQDYTNSTASA